MPPIQRNSGSRSPPPDRNGRNRMVHKRGRTDGEESLSQNEGDFSPMQSEALGGTGIPPQWPDYGNPEDGAD
jgi:hypothetical protein